MSEYLGNRDVLFDPSNGTQPANDLQRYPGQIWPPNNPVGTEYVQGMGNQSGPFVPAPPPGWNAQRIMAQPGADIAMGYVLGVDGGAPRAGSFKPVVNDAGAPLTLYHGTNSQFSTFEPAQIGSGADSRNLAGPTGMLGEGFYFTPSQTKAADYGEHQMPVQLSMHNPLVLGKGGQWDHISDAVASITGKENYNRKDYQGILKGAGYDGVIKRDYFYPELDEYVAFDPAQIRRQPARIENPLTVYHGTPHTFAPTEGNPLGEFDPTKIGSGEGFQAYGHGLYTAGSEDVARGYRDRLSGASITPGASDYVPGYAVNGAYPPTGMAGHAAMDTAIDMDGLLSYMHMHENKPSLSTFWKPGDPISPDFDARPSYQRSMDYLRGQIEGRIQRFRDSLGGREPSGSAERDMSALADYYDQNVRNATPADVTKRPPGRIYETEFHAEPDELLDWDKPISQQSPYVQERLRQMPYVQERLRELGEARGWEGLGEQTGEDIIRLGVPRTSYSIRADANSPWGPSGASTYEDALAQVGGDKSRVLRVNTRDPAYTSEALHNAGIKGIRYMDAGSRNVMVRQNRDGQWAVQQTSPGMPTHYSKYATAEEAQAAADKLRTYNYVAFDPTTLNIVRRYGIPALIGGGGAAAAAGGQQQ